MRNGAVGDLIRLAVYAVAVLILTLWLSPVVFQGGKALAEVSLGRPTNRPLAWCANWAAGAGFHEFFVITFLGLAVLLLPLLAERLGAGVLPARTLFFGTRQWRVARAGGIGFLMVLASGAVLALMRGAGWRVEGLVWVLGMAIALAFVFEWVFRGMLFGLLERHCRPAGVVAVSALAFTGFRLILPPPDFAYGDPESWTLGWQMFGKLPAHVFGGVLDFLPLLGWSVLLGIARMRDRSLWSPFFLHAGWLVAVGLFDSTAHTWISWGALCAGLGWFCFVRKCRASNEGD